MIDLDALAQAASALDPLPTSATRLAAMVCIDGTPDLLDVVDVVRFDEALTAMLLRTANSSWSASRVEITTVRDAVVRLGASAVLSVALGTGVRSRMVTSIPEYGLAEGELWSHSVAASLAAELIVRISPVNLPVETITGALLHDVGKLVMARFLSADLLELLATRQADATPPGSDRLDAESELLGVNHAELGGLILQCWTLPERLVRAVSYHHRPELGLDLTCSGAHLADVIAKRVGLSGPKVGRAGAGERVDDNVDPERFAAALADLQLTADDADQIAATTKARLEEVLARYAA